MNLISTGKLSEVSLTKEIECRPGYVTNEMLVIKRIACSLQKVSHNQKPKKWTPLKYNTKPLPYSKEELKKVSMS